jgi:hypothetical protein
MNRSCYLALGIFLAGPPLLKAGAQQSAPAAAPVPPALLGTLAAHPDWPAAMNPSDVDTVRIFRLDDASRPCDASQAMHDPFAEPGSTHIHMRGRARLCQAPGATVRKVGSGVNVKQESL